MNADVRFTRANVDTYVVPNSLLSAGPYPGSPPGTHRRDVAGKLQEFIDVGVRVFIDLTTKADRLAPYVPDLMPLSGGQEVEVIHESLPIKDMSVCEPSHMIRVLDTIDGHMQAGRPVYLHCWGGIGRTGMVVGCWLVRHGKSGEQALTEVNRLFRTMSPARVAKHAALGSPQTAEQRDVVRNWAGNDSTSRLTRPSTTIRDAWRFIAPNKSATPELRDRVRGALIGLAVGDAVGTTVEFKSPGSFPPVKDMVGGGPFKLAPGEWTDDTSMALCLAESLIEKRTFDARDQMKRYTKWFKNGHLSSNGRCFDIGITVREALARFTETKDPFAGSTAANKAGNGSLMRLAPIPMFYFRSSGEDAVEMAAYSSQTTHATAVAVDACRYLAALIIGAFNGASKEELLSARFEPRSGYWNSKPLDPIIASIADGSFKRKAPPAIKGTGYAADSLEAALWAFQHSADFREGCLLAVNLGDDADTTAAVYGQLAGAFYGESSIPSEWRNKLAKKSVIDRYAELLFQLSFRCLPAIKGRTAEIKADAARAIGDAGGNAFEALREVLGEDHTEGAYVGSMGMGGSMHAQSSYEELVLQLRVAVGEALAES